MPAYRVPACTPPRGQYGSEEDSDEFEEVDFEDLEDCRSIASDDSFYPPDDVFADSERSPSPESPEPLSFFKACCTNNAAIVRIMIRHGVKEEEIKETDRNNRCMNSCMTAHFRESRQTRIASHFQSNFTSFMSFGLSSHCPLNFILLPLLPLGASLNARDFGRNLTAREWALFTGRYETAWLMTRLMERPYPFQYPQEPRGCLKRLSDTVRNVFNIANVTNPEDEGVIDHLVSVTTAMRSPFIAVACRTVCPDSPPSVGKRRYAVPEIVRKQRAKELLCANPDRVDSHRKLFQNSRVTLVAKNSEDRRSSLQVHRVVPRHRSSSLGMVSHTQALELRRTSLLPLHMVLRRSSVRPGLSIPKVRISKAPSTTYEPEPVRRKSSAKDGGGNLLQIPKWRYKELKEERRKAEEAERKRLEAVTRRHIAAGKRK
uniref:Uncharacterized protein n=1 Tax=Xiphophorus couchianus TaxID=32473 RepID=A0A3B5LJU3_9TELE